MRGRSSQALLQHRHAVTKVIDLWNTVRALAYNVMQCIDGAFCGCLYCFVASLERTVEVCDDCVYCKYGGPVEPIVTHFRLSFTMPLSRSIQMADSTDLVPLPVAASICFAVLLG